MNPRLYDAVFTAAVKRFAGPSTLPRVRLTQGTALYRYTRYVRAMGDPADARKIWSSLGNDTGNRWTGKATGGASRGSQGLYLSAEFLDIAKPFPELEHYMGKEPEPKRDVLYYEYAPKQPPRLVPAKVEALRSMFLFSLTEESQGLDLTLVEGHNPLLAEILDAARTDAPDAFDAGATLTALHDHPDDASFCRAIGNAAFESTEARFIQVTSVRDGKSTNVVWKGQGGQTVDVLKPEGRCTFFMDPQGRVAKGVYTLLDLQYNALFDETGMDVIPPREVVKTELADIAGQVVDAAVERFDEQLGTTPPSDQTENVAEQLSGISDDLQAGDAESALSKIADVQETLDDLPHQNLAQSEVKAMTTVKQVMGSLSAITEAVKVAGEENKAGEAERAAELEPMRDPTEEEVFPKEDPAPHGGSL